MTPLTRALAVVLLVANATGALAQIPNNPAAASVLGQTGFTTRTTGTTAATFNGPNGVAVDLATGAVFVADRTNNRVLRFSSAAALQNGGAAEAVLGQTTFATVATGLAANRMNNPIGVHVDGAGRLWVADFGNNRVLRFDGAATKASGADADGVLGQATFTTNAAVLSATGMRSPVTAFPDNQGRLWVTEFQSHRVTRFDNAAASPNGDAADGVLGQPNFTTGVAGRTATTLSSPNGSYVDPQGRLYVSDNGNFRVVRFDAAAASPDGDAADGVLGQPDFTSGVSAVTRAGVSTVRFVTGDSAGRLYIVQEASNRITVYENAAAKPNGGDADYVIGQPNFTTGTAPNPPTASSFNTPRAIVIDEERDAVWVADFTNNRVLRFAIGYAGTLTLTGAEGWRMLASAYTDQTYASLLGPLWTQGFPGADAAGGQPNVVLYDETAAGGLAAGYVPPASQADAYPQGRGIFAYVYADDDFATAGTQGGFPKAIAQAGAPAVGPFPFAPTFTSSGTDANDGWNLLGNPFAASMNWDAAGWTKTNVDNTFYVWDPNAAGGAQYLSWNGTTGSLGSGVLAPNQGFWVKATAAGPVLAAPAVAVAPGGVFHGRQAAVLTIGLRLRGTFGDVALGTSTFASFQPDAALGHDVYDAYELAPLTDTFLQLYAVSDADEALDLVALPADLTGPVEIALGVRAVVAGLPAGATVTMTWPDLRDVPADWEVRLVDRETGASVDLRTETSYAFSLPAAGLLVPDAPSAAVDFRTAPTAPRPLRVDAAALTAGRLALVVGPRGTTAAEGDAPAASALYAVRPNPVAGAGALVQFDLAEATDARVELFDMLGRRVAVLADGALAAGPHTARLDASALPPGAYVVRLTAGQTTQTQRLTIVR